MTLFMASAALWVCLHLWGNRWVITAPCRISKLTGSARSISTCTNNVRVVPTATSQFPDPHLHHCSWATAVLHNLAPSSPQPVVLIRLPVPMSPRGSPTLKWRFNQISGIVLLLHHPGLASRGASSPLLSLQRRVGRDEAQLLIAGLGTSKGRCVCVGGDSKEVMLVKITCDTHSHTQLLINTPPVNLPLLCWLWAKNEYLISRG